MIVSSQVDQRDVEEMILFYKQHFHEVSLVSCLQCNAPLAFELRGDDPMGMAVNDLGLIVVPIGDALQSSRIRLDETPEGEHMMGYQCGAPVPNPLYAKAKAEHDKEIDEIQAAHDKAVKEAKKNKTDPPPDLLLPELNVPEFVECGNDTRLGEAERGLVPAGRSLVQLSPFERHKITQQIKESKTKPHYEKRDKIKILDTFQVERIK